MGGSIHGCAERSAAWLLGNHLTWLHLPEDSAQESVVEWLDILPIARVAVERRQASA